MDSAAQKLESDEIDETVRLSRLVEELRRDIRARDDFIAIAAHELRNPMMPIQGSAELALMAARKAKNACPPRIIMLLERLEAAIQDFTLRATRLLDVTRIETGNLKLSLAAMDLSDVIAVVAQGYEITAIRGGGALQIEIESGITAVLDRHAVEQVIENLISNALKFGAGKLVTLRVRLAGQSAIITVQDRGIGMDAAQQSRIFGRFEQVMSQYEGSGFGIGLWVASRLVQAMNGQITVLSNPGEGATFSVTLPLEPLPH